MTSSREDDPNLALWFTPDAIKGHYDTDNDERARWVKEEATDEQLSEIGEAALSGDSIYKAFCEVLDMLVDDAKSANPTR